MESLTSPELPQEVEFERFGGGAAKLVRLTRENIGTNDIQRITEICNQAPVKKWVTKQYSTGENGTYTPQDAYTFVEFGSEGWESNTSFVYLIRDTQDRIMGTVDIKSNDRNGAEVGYWADTSEGQGGYMTNAVLALADSAKHAGYKQLYGFVEPENEASKAVIGRAGFVENEIVKKEIAGEQKEFLKVVATFDENHGD